MVLLKTGTYILLGWMCNAVIQLGAGKHRGWQGHFEGHEKVWQSGMKMSLRFVGNCR